MATVYRIHPAIGIARIGNSPDEFFIGPELVGAHPAPQGGFKDPQCRVKRQAARFRIFAHHADGSVAEVTSADADITWTVHLVNKKAANPGRSNAGPASDLTIDPGPRTLTGPDQREQFDTGSIKFTTGARTKVPLGEVRSDHENRLLVLGGFGHSASPTGTALNGFWATPGWFDDVSDGPVTATIKLLADHSTPAVTGAWVIVAPPKFAPHQDSVITLYDRVFQAMVDGGKLAKPTRTSYTQDIYPILHRARDTRWVVDVLGSHTWADPVTSAPVRDAIFARLKKPGGGGGDMPDINDSGTDDDRLTDTQYAHMSRWHKGDPADYALDWVGPPAAQANATPNGLTRAALEACVGGAFYPGIEAGGLPGSRPIIDAGNFGEALRLDHGVVSAGDMTYVMALPWQNDFYQCADNWWPVPRPNAVERSGASAQDWITGVVNSSQDMVDKWDQLGFVVRQGNQLVEAERCSTPSITLLTPLLDFQDVPQGPMGMVREVPLAISFEVISPGGAVTLEYAPSGAPSHPQLIVFNASVTVGPTTANASAVARLWLIFRTASAGDVLPPQHLRVRQQGGTQQWDITVIGNTVARKTTATALTLDRSGSMSEDRGDGQSKHDSLQQAASIFVDVMLEGDGVGIVSFNQTSSVLQSILGLGAGGLADANRTATKNVIDGNGLDPQGATSIGNGIYDARGILTTTTTPYDCKALVVLTDGVENRPRYISDVAPQINARTYAVGLGTPQNTSAPALQAISGNNGGFLLLTGAITQDNRFLLQKYFLAILSGISDAEVVLDPDGQLLPGRVERVPFRLIRGDAGVDVILLTPYPSLVDFRLLTPSGQLIEPWMAASEPGLRYVQSSDVSYYRLVLPRPFQANRVDQEGTWHALLTLGAPRDERSMDSRTGTDASVLQRDVPPVRTDLSRRLQASADSAARSRTVDAMNRQGATTGIFVAPSRSVLPFSLVVHTYSNVSLQASAEQNTFEPGAAVALAATLSRSGMPLSMGAQVWSEVTRPDGTEATVTFVEAEAGRFTASYVTSGPGIYRFRVRARGTSERGEAFTRERTLTIGVWRGGDRDAIAEPPGSWSAGGARGWEKRICDLLHCMVGADGDASVTLAEKLRAFGVNPALARDCLSLLCSGEDDRGEDVADG